MIYCVEDDDNIRDLIIYTLNSTGFEAKGFVDSLSFFPALAKCKPELILLDITLPYTSGIDILKQLKSSTSTQHIPVILITAKSSEYDKIQGLDLGADDFVTKPFGIMELVARVKAVLRRTYKENKKALLTYKELSLDLDRHSVHVNQTAVSLTLKEFKLLQKLIENQSLVLTREQLLEEIWGYDYYGETRTVDVHIRSLRVKLGDAGQYIETVRGVGYRLVDSL